MFILQKWRIFLPGILTVKFQYGWTIKTMNGIVIATSRLCTNRRNCNKMFLKVARNLKYVTVCPDWQDIFIADFRDMKQSRLLRNRR